MTDRHQQTPYPLRMSPELKEQVTAAAKVSGRSMHSEILARLQDSFTPSSTPINEGELFRHLIESRVDSMNNRLDTNKIREELLRSRLETLALRNKELERKKNLLLSDPSSLSNEELDQIAEERDLIGLELRKVKTDLEAIKDANATYLVELETAKQIVASQRALLESKLKHT